MASLRADYDQYEADFLRYYPALREHADRWLADVGATRPFDAKPQD